MRIFILLSLVALTTCKKQVAFVHETKAAFPCTENPFPLDTNYFPSAGVGWHNSGYVNDSVFMYPCFNPLDNNQFSYILLLTQFPPRYELHTHDLLTEADETILESCFPKYKPQWCANGWIYLDDHNGQFNRVHATTHEFQNLLWVGFRYWTFNPKTGESYFRRSDLDTQLNCVHIDSTGKILDQAIGYTSPHAAWRDSLMYAGIDSDGISKIEQLGQTYTGIITWDDAGIVEDMAIHPNMTDIFFNTFSHSMYKVNRLTKERTLIKEGSNACYVRQHSISPNGEKLLVERQYYIQIVEGNFQTRQNNEIWLMDIDGCNDHRLLPE